MSGRIGALKTAGSVWVSLLGLPSPPWMVTVGRLVILAGVVQCCQMVLDFEIC